MSSSLMLPFLPLLVTLTRTVCSHFSTFQLSARCPACVAVGGMAYTYCGDEEHTNTRREKSVPLAARVRVSFVLVPSRLHSHLHQQCP